MRQCVGTDVRIALIGLSLALSLTSGCRRERPAPSYSQRVAPILERRCVSCHGSTPGHANVSPALDTPAAAQRVAKQSLLAVQRREMPPWGADGSGSCGRFVDAAWLDDREIDTLRRWAEGGAPLGKPSGPALEAGRAAPSPFAWLLQPAPGEQRIDLQSEFTPRAGSAARCFRGAPPPPGSWVLGALGLRSEPPLAVQQLQLYTLSDAAQLAALQRLEDEDPEPGWSCPGGSRVESSELVTSWSWLEPLQRLPAGSSLRAAAGLPLLVRVTYNLAGDGVAGHGVRATAELVLRPAPAHPAALQPLSVPELRLPAGQQRVERARTLDISEPSRLLGVIPQLNELGRSLSLERVHAGRRECLASFPHWAPAQQQLFRYRSGLELDAGDSLRLSCSFDTSSRSQEVLGGEEPGREQCRLFLYLAARE
jgi:hypothetical protein